MNALKRTRVWGIQEREKNIFLRNIFEIYLQEISTKRPVYQGVQFTGSDPINDLKIDLETCSISMLNIIEEILAQQVGRSVSISIRITGLKAGRINHENINGKLTFSTSLVKVARHATEIKTQVIPGVWIQLDSKTANALATTTLSAFESGKFRNITKLIAGSIGEGMNVNISIKGLERLNDYIKLAKYTTATEIIAFQLHDLNAPRLMIKSLFPEYLDKIENHTPGRPARIQAHDKARMLEVLNMGDRALTELVGRECGLHEAILDSVTRPREALALRCIVALRYVNGSLCTAKAYTLKDMWFICKKLRSDIPERYQTFIPRERV